jgi:putative flippase GtrA
MKDFLIVSLIGFLVGWLILPVAVNFNFEITFLFIFLSVIGFAVLAPSALGVIYFLGRFWPILRQFGRFAAVGTLNTLINFGILNLLMYFTGITRGIYYSLFIAIAFVAAVTNSYFWNKFWSFQSKNGISLSEFSRFLIITIVGLLINDGVASFLVNVLGPIDGFSAVLWANLSALAGVAAAFLWNFCGYRYIIFK